LCLDLDEGCVGELYLDRLRPMCRWVVGTDRPEANGCRAARLLVHDGDAPCLRGPEFGSALLQIQETTNDNSRSAAPNRNVAPIAKDLCTYATTSTERDFCDSPVRTQHTRVALLSPFAGQPLNALFSLVALVTLHALDTLVASLTGLTLDALRTDRAL